MADEEQTDWRAELRSFCRLILERRGEEELSTHVVTFFLEEDAALIAQRAEWLLRRSQPPVLAKEIGQ